MTFKALRIAVAALVFQAVMMVGPALAQDFDSLVSSAASANQQWVDQTNLALQADDLATLQSRASAAVATGQQVESLLTQALSLAPDDASRSRVEGVLTHVRAALEAGVAALEATEFDAARASVDAMRGEAQEALGELAPFAAERGPAPGPEVAQAPVELPRSGEGPLEGTAAGIAALLAFGGLTAALAGLGLRRRFA